MGSDRSDQRKVSLGYQCHMQYARGIWEIASIGTVGFNRRVLSKESMQRFRAHRRCWRALGEQTEAADLELQRSWPRTAGSRCITDVHLSHRENTRWGARESVKAATGAAKRP
jgi:hypothetical protein